MPWACILSIAKVSFNVIHKYKILAKNPDFTEPGVKAHALYL